MSVHRWILGLCLTSVTAMCVPCEAQTDEVGPLDGDLNSDSFVGITDLSIVLSHWGQTVTPGDLLNGDPSANGTVGIEDLNIVLSNWNTGYPLPTQRDLQLGINLSQVNYFSREWVFVDAVKQSKPWVATNPNGNPFDTGETVETDINGWPLLQPGTSAQTLMFSQMQGAYPTGEYICTYEGTGVLVFQWDGLAIDSEPGRITVDVNPTNTGILMRIAESDPSDPIRNIKLWMPGFENAQSPFHPLFLQRMSKFKVLRFMDWGHTNEVTDTTTWSNRTRVSHVSQGGDNGVAIEYMIWLCNELDADPWFCIPHTADDIYITNFATLVRGHLEPERKIYLEWSNEVWNSRFDAYGYVEVQSDSSAYSPGWFDYWANRLTNTFMIWNWVFAGQEDRLVRVAAGQAANVWVTRNLSTRLGDQVDAVACAAYFGEDGADFDATTTAQQIISDAMNRAIPKKSTRFYNDHGDLASDLTEDLGRTIRLIGYEGGQHYADDNRNVPFAQALLDMQYLPGMFSAYLMNLNAFEQAGADLICPFNYVDRPGNHGAWGHLEKQDESLENSEKFRALLYYVKDQP